MYIVEYLIVSYCIASHVFIIYAQICKQFYRAGESFESGHAAYTEFYQNRPIIWLEGGGVIRGVRGGHDMRADNIIVVFCHYWEAQKNNKRYTTL